MTFTGLLWLGYVVSNVLKMNVCFGKGCKFMNSVLSVPYITLCLFSAWCTS